jgi:hypothetical protein
MHRILLRSKKRTRERREEKKTMASTDETDFQKKQADFQKKQADFQKKQANKLKELPVEFREFVAYQAWERGHSCGFAEVLLEVHDLVDGLKECIQKYTNG